MDAVTYMDASKRPQPDAAAAAPQSPPRRRPSISSSSSLVAVVATLVLALGVGVMIGRSGEDGASNAAAPQIIRVGGGGETPAATASTVGAGGASGGKGGKKADPATVKKAKEKAATGDSGASKATEEVFEPAPGVKIAPPEQQLGGDCDPSVAGCNSKGEFEGDFFE